MSQWRRARGRVATWPQQGRTVARGFANRAQDGLSRFIEILRGWTLAEAGPGRLLPWLPVAFGSGLAAYFAAAREPILWIVAPVAIVMIFAALVLRRSRAFVTLALVAAAFAGFACATWRTARIAHGVLTQPVFSAQLAGFVEVREERERSDRFVLRVDRMDVVSGRPIETKIERVRLSVKKGTAPAVGSYVELKARLSPPFTATHPGGYDFARDLYFQRIGASGFVLGSVRGLDPPQAGGWWLGYAVAISSMRDAIDARIRSALQGDARAIASALLTGKRDAISSPVNDAMFVSGLGHVLSISGYHMAVVAGVVFFVVRGLLAMLPVLMAVYPIKKWSAAVALLAATFYLLLSGAEVATQRSFLMTAVVLVGVMVDRRAITFRTLAVAAMAVLLITPEAIVHPSFQMSFAATLAIVAVVALGAPPILTTPGHSLKAKAMRWLERKAVMLLLASLVAGIATMPYAAYHFHRAAPLGLFANLMAMPVVSAWVMPAGILGILAIPFGFDDWCWWLMGFGIGWMTFVAQWVASWPGAVGRLSAFGVAPLLLMTLGIVAIGLLRTPLRWSGALLLAGGTILALSAPRPDILISTDGASVAARGSDGRLRVMQTKKDQFVLRDWLAADGDMRAPDDPSLKGASTCDDAGCVLPLVGGGYITLALRSEAFTDDCSKAIAIVTMRQPPADCAAQVFDHKRLEESGSVTLRRVGGRFIVETVKPAGMDRPWARGTQVQSTAVDFQTNNRSTTPRTVDATPAEIDLAPDDQ